MDLWNETLDKINSMEVIKNNNKFYVLVNNRFLIREFHQERPYEFFNAKTAQDFINDMQEGIDAFKTSQNKRGRGECLRSTRKS